MDLLVRWTALKRNQKKDSDDLNSGQESDIDCKRKAAAASTAVAIALSNISFLSPQQTNNQSMSAWQLVHRNQTLNSRRGFT
ncbi:MAG: hypothetical protein J7L66_00890, partial [Anaerolineaceae bacterium]|nr:hypothetical protein [Anaerolineaceae bacterium]